MRFAACLVTLAFLVGCAPYHERLEYADAYTLSGAKVTRVSGHHVAKLEYKSPEVLRREAEHRASQRRVASSPETIPAGGMLILTVYGITLEAADLRHWEVAVEDLDGQQIVYRRGHPDLPSVSYYSWGANWFNTLVTYLPQEMTEPFNVFVYDDLSAATSQFQITPP